MENILIDQEKCKTLTAADAKKIFNNSFKPKSFILYLPNEKSGTDSRLENEKFMARLEIDDPNQIDSTDLSELFKFNKIGSLPAGIQGADKLFNKVGIVKSLSDQLVKGLRTVKFSQPYKIFNSTSFQNTFLPLEGKHHTLAELNSNIVDSLSMDVKTQIKPKAIELLTDLSDTQTKGEKLMEAVAIQAGIMNYKIDYAAGAEISLPSEIEAKIAAPELATKGSLQEYLNKLNDINTTITQLKTKIDDPKTPVPHQVQQLFC